MRRLHELVVVVLLFTVFAGVAQASSQTGSFILFVGGMEAGREEYSFTAEELKTQGVIALGGQRLEVNTVLKAAGEGRFTYELEMKPGASLALNLSPGKLEVEVGPIRRTFALEGPFVILENNVFAHFEQVVSLFREDVDQLDFTVVVPSVVMANQSPVLSGSAVRRGQVNYQLAGEPLPLDEYVVTLAGGLQVRILAQGDKMIVLEVPLQAVEVVREGYVGLQKAVEGPSTANHFRTEEFQVANGEITLAGTLSLPLGEGPFPAILLNSGSGPQDRDGNSPPALMTNMFAILADRLTEVGIAVLRYDERGVGASTGDYNAADLDDLLSDVEALLDFLGNHPLIDSSRMAMLGHSEGAYFAPLFADRLSALVLLAGPSAPLDEIMLEQLDYQMTLPWLSEEEKAYLAALKTQTELMLQEAREGKEESSVLPYNLEWIRQHMALSPKENVAQVKGAVLIVQGEEDYQVLPYHAEVLAQCLREAGNGRVTVQFLPETSHLFTYAVTSEQFDALNPFELNPELVETVVKWLAENL